MFSKGVKLIFDKNKQNIACVLLA